ncbi:hypothetical protein KKG90_07165 [Candidatus Bipolaricaulota bacterium]|nr:hypothetical protein [Candidatus Bipolaricaulota bacterium]
MRTIGITLAVAVMCLTTVCGDSMDAQGTASGNVVLYFSGTRATGSFDSTFALSGQLTIDDAIVAFSAAGWARGAGSGDTVTLDLDAQATFAATGSTEAGERISVQGGLTLSGLTAGASGSSGSGMGEFYATIFIAERVYRVRGDAEGSASGGFVVPKDPYSMELAGDGLFHLSGELTLIVSPEAADDASTDSSATSPEEVSHQQAVDSVLDDLPWDTATWPEALLAELLEILTNVVDVAEVNESSPVAD